jgi:3-oxoacyl-[acyl-carrier protein] reductase
MDLQNKVCIVTGGAKGIGRKIVEAFCKEGASTCIWDVDIKSLNALGETLIKNNSSLENKLIIQKVDVTNAHEIREAIRTILHTFGTIHILVNNVGLYTIDDITKEDEDNWNRIIDTNLKSAFLCIKEVLPTMIENRYGKIVNISSISGKKESIFASPSYCASKAGIIGLTRCVAAQMAKHSINVNCVAPAITDTDIISILGNSQIESALKSIPLGRIGKPEDIANAVLFLVKDSSNFITGETTNVNGGSFME